MVTLNTSGIALIYREAEYVVKYNLPCLRCLEDYHIYLRTTTHIWPSITLKHLSLFPYWSCQEGENEAITMLMLVVHLCPIVDMTPQ